MIRVVKNSLKFGAICVMVSLLVACSDGVTSREDYDRIKQETESLDDSEVDVDALSNMTWKNKVVLTNVDTDFSSIEDKDDFSWFVGKSLEEVYNQMHENGYILMNIGTPNLYKTYNNYKLNLDLGYTFNDVKILSYNISDSQYKVTLEFGKPREKVVVSLKYTYELDETKSVLMKGINGLGNDWKLLEISYN